jgi:hypothetical protein
MTACRKKQAWRVAVPSATALHQLFLNHSPIAAPTGCCTASRVITSLPHRVLAPAANEAPSTRGLYERV